MTNLTIEQAAASIKTMIARDATYRPECHYTLLNGDWGWFICIPIEKLGRKLQNDDEVHLDGGRVLTPIVRKVRVRGGTMHFVPLDGKRLSADERTPAKDATVKGIVIGHCKRLRRFI